MAFCEAEAYRIEAIGMFIKVGIQEDANPMLYDTAEVLWCLASVGLSSPTRPTKYFFVPLAVKR